MKLITKISRYYLLNSTLLFIVAFTAIYFALNWTITEEIDEQLYLNQKEAAQKYKEGYKVNNPPFVEIKKVSQFQSNEISYSDTSIYLAEEEENEPYRQSVSYFSYNEENYKVTIRTSLIEKEDLLLSLLLIFSIVFLLMVAILYFINRKTTKDIFRPFYNNLEKLRKFNIRTNKKIELEKSNIDEFIELNSAIEELSVKAGKEYATLKEFTEDLSHELQTPVSIIKNNLELLLQKEISDNEAVENITRAYQNINRLDKINRSLVLLSKLESTDMFETSTIRPDQVLKKVIQNFTDIAEAKNIKIHKDIYSGGSIKVNDTLFELLLGNLISNAIKHNIPEGKVFIKFENMELIVSNTCETDMLEADKVFKRFVKDKKSHESIGLGLSIVKKICDLYGYEIKYNYEKNMHKFEVLIK